MDSRVVLILLLHGCRLFEHTSGFLLDGTGTIACLVPEYCKNGGKCFYDANGNRKCNCQPGWDGRLCETASTTTPGTLSSHAYTGACIENERCATISTVCDNPATASLCPVKCQLCTLTTTPSTTSPHTFAGACIENDVCSTMTTVCDNPTTASLCPVKCHLCAPTSTPGTHLPHTFAAPTTTPGTHLPHTFAGACIENEMCSTMTTVCDNPTTASLCPVKCHLCASITTASTIQPPLTYTGSCTDDVGCISKDLLEIVCRDPSLVSMCPRSCGLCSTPTGTTTFASTTQTTQVSTGSIFTMTQTTLLTPTHATKTTSSVPTTTSKTKTTSSLPTTTHFTSKNAVQCQTCLGPSAYCEDWHELTTCEPPNNFCINHVINDRDGSRNVNRTCGNYDTCFHEWYESTSDNDRCQVFDGSIVTLAFECTYCCTVDNCNLRLHPSGNTMFIPSV